ncbi:MAG: hydroxyisourate hydrolase [Actinomycetota bacterium]|nr:hydroxyisourate hydrolase [Actinomycetota bacterium]
MISTHVLDTERGEPRAGLKVGLYRGDALLSEQQTDDDGRIAELAPDRLEPGEYRLVFHVGGEFFREVELTLSIEDPDRHFHVPLLVSSYACTTYRGS